MSSHHETSKPHGDEALSSSHSSVGFFVAIWIALLILLGVSLALGSIQDVYLMNALVFGVAIVKACMVIVAFMHVRLEPKGIIAIFAFALLCLLILWKGASPDVPYDSRHPPHNHTAPSL